MTPRSPSLCTLSLLAALLAAPLSTARQDEAPLLTRAEASQGEETSSYDDIVSFLEELQARGASCVVEYIGESERGRGIPLVIASRPPVSSPAEARRTGRPVVYLQANIHGAEVEGKEAVLALLRDLYQEDESENFLDQLVLLVAPIYNIDGNDSWGDVKAHRGSQNGPARVGLRPNGQGLDLNRDCMKAESPEMRAVLSKVYNTWDPDVMMDLHTTNGTRHGYALTYSPPLGPDTEPGVLAFARDELLPAVRRRMRDKHGLETIDYGNASRRGEPRWSTFGCEPRYVTNYVGLRNRIAILSEATSYSTFNDRILATRRFVEEVLLYVVERADDVVRITREADAAVANRAHDAANAAALGVRFQMTSRGKEPVLLEKPEARPSPYRPVPVEEVETIEMEVFDRFAATESARPPAAYVLPPDLRDVVELLQRHGVVVEELPHGWSGPVETFAIEKVGRSNRPFQGHRLVDLDGAWESSERRLPPGTILVRCAQPLGVLIFHLLEPRSLDGAAAWGFFDSALHEGGPYPIRRCLAPVTAPRVRLSRGG